MPPGDDALIDLSDEAPAAEAGVSSEVVKDPRPKGTFEEAPRCKLKRRKSSKLIPGGDARSLPTKFGEQVTGDHFIKNLLYGGGDPNFPINTVAVALYDRATEWLASYPKATK